MQETQKLDINLIRSSATVVARDPYIAVDRADSMGEGANETDSDLFSPRVLIYDSFALPQQRVRCGEVASLSVRECTAVSIRTFFSDRKLHEQTEKKV